MVMEGNHPEANVAVSGGMADWGGQFFRLGVLAPRSHGPEVRSWYPPVA